MTDAGAGAGAGASPFIAGTDMSATGDFSDLFDYDDDTIAAAAAAAVTSPFHQSLDLSKDQSLSGFNPQALHNPTTASSTLGARDIAAAESPDSLNDSFRDSSSDSGSSKRTGSSASGKIALTAGDIIMTDGNDIKKEWNSASFSKGSEDGTFIFGSNMPSSVMGDNFDLPTDDNFMNDSFDFESASSSPEAANNAATNLASPDMPTMTAHIPHNSQTPSKSKSQAPRKKSQFPLTQPMHGLHMSASREVSPLSQNVASQQASPSNFFNNSPSPTNQPDFSNHVAAAVGHPFWPQVDGGHAMPPGFPMMQQFHPQLMQQMLFAQGGFNPMPYHCKLIIHPTPTKSRVETQIPIKMTLLGAPPGVKRLHLPTHTISKPKLLAKSPSERSPDMLELYTQLVCTSAMLVGDNKQRAFKRAAAASHPHPSLNERSASEDSNEEDKPQNGGEVRICQGCITRERKRAGRKKIKKVEEEEMWKKDENRRVIVFNTNEIKEWQPPSATPADPAVAGPPEPQYPAGALQVDAPMRIACYCRHHAEKMGFRVVFTIKDWQDRVVAQEMSHSIMITDDHKTHPVPQTLNAIGSQGEENSVVPMVNAPLETSPLSTPAPFRVSQSSSDLQSLRRNGSTQLPGPPPLPAPPPVVKHQTPPASAPSVPALSRPASPSLSNMGPASKKRKAGGPRVPMEMAMTRLDTSPPPGTQPSASQAPATAPASTSPFTPNLGLNLQMPDNMFAQTGAVQNVPPPFATGPTTPNNISDQNMFGNAARSASMDNLAMTMFSAPTSAHPSRAPSPNSLRQSLGGVPQTPMAHGLINGMTFLPGSQSQSRPQPTIHKIIPGEGPKMGGIEVTILGGGFFQGLDVYFGEHKATTTTFWGESSLVCLLPPASRPGIVPVSLKQSQAQSPPFKPNPNQVFRYTDDEEAQLARMMIGMISQKMTGQLLDVRELAQRIMGPQDMDWSSMGGGSSSGGGFGGGNTYSTSTESQLLKCLELIDLDDSARMPRLDLRRNTGQAMLHFGCSLGYHRFVAGLLARGANPDLRDKGGFTPMHMAAINDHEAIVRRLMQAGADPTIRSLSGLRPADVARSRKVIEHIRRCERHVRSRSGGSLHSRASSAASLRSLWDPHAVSEESDDPGDGEESPEYSSGDFESEDEAEDNWLNMRRSSTHAYGAPTERDSLSEERDELQRVPGSPTTALAAAVRDQVSAQLHQFQQAMAMHFPNMSQMPNLPQMPNFPRMSMLPDYQQYLHQHPLMGRMTSFMEGMSGSRPGSAGDETPKAMDGKWWDFSSLLNNNNNTASPPAYTELYPQDALDKKQASAAGAAAEAEADAKCAKLFDTATAEAIEETSEAATSEAPVPKALMIGRKKAMTKEQQQDFLRAHAAKFKGIRSDKNLWFIWIPLLTVLLASMLYIRFPEHFATAWSMIRSVPAQQGP